MGAGYMLCRKRYIVRHGVCALHWHQPLMFLTIISPVSLCLAYFALLHLALYILALFIISLALRFVADLAIMRVLFLYYIAS